MPRVPHTHRSCQHVSNEKRAPIVRRFVGDEILHSYMLILIVHEIRIPSKEPEFNGKYTIHGRFFLWLMKSVFFYPREASEGVDSGDSTGSGSGTQSGDQKGTSWGTSVNVGH